MTQNDALQMDFDELLKKDVNELTPIELNFLIASQSTKISEVEEKIKHIKSQQTELESTKKELELKVRELKQINKGRKPFDEAFKLISLKLPMSMLVQMDIAKKYYANSQSEYIRTLIQKDLDENYENYKVSYIKSLNDNK